MQVRRVAQVDRLMVVVKQATHLVWIKSTTTQQLSLWCPKEVSTVLKWSTKTSKKCQISQEKVRKWTYFRKAAVKAIKKGLFMRWWIRLFRQRMVIISLQMAGKSQVSTLWERFRAISKCIHQEAPYPWLRLVNFSTQLSVNRLISEINHLISDLESNKKHHMLRPLKIKAAKSGLPEMTQQRRLTS